MVPKPEKRLELLEQMRKSKSNWKKEDIEKLYKEFGFTIRHAAVTMLLHTQSFQNYELLLPDTKPFPKAMSNLR